MELLACLIQYLQMGIKFRVTGVIVHGIMKNYIIWDDRNPHGSNQNFHCILETLAVLKRMGRPLPKKFILMMDNSSKDNKCEEFIFKLWWLVRVGEFDEVLVHSER